jgi:hypothetical protein
MHLPELHNVRVHLVDVFQSIDSGRERMRLQQLSIVETYLAMLSATREVKIREMLLAKAVYAFQLSGDSHLTAAMRFQRNRIWERLLEAERSTASIQAQATRSPLR